MKLSFDLDERTIDVGGKRVELYSSEGFRIVKDLWLKVGWNENIHTPSRGSERRSSSYRTTCCAIRRSYST